MKTSWNRISEFERAAAVYLAGNVETKMAYALNKVLKQVKALSVEVQEKLADIEIDNCVTERVGDEDVILRDDHGSLRFTKEGLKKRNHDKTDYLSEPRFEITPHFAALASNLPTNMIEALTGFVIREEDAASILAEREGSDG